MSISISYLDLCIYIYICVIICIYKSYTYMYVGIFFGVVVSKLTIWMLEKKTKLTRHNFSNKGHMLFRLGGLAVETPSSSSVICFKSMSPFQPYLENIPCCSYRLYPLNIRHLYWLIPKFSRYRHFWCFHHHVWQLNPPFSSWNHVTSSFWSLDVNVWWCPVFHGWIPMVQKTNILNI